MNGEGGRTDPHRGSRAAHESESVPTLPQPPDDTAGGAGPFDSEVVRTALLPDQHPPAQESAAAAVSADEPPVGSLIAGRYELLQRVAGGSMGVVYKALDREATLGTHQPVWVALKLLRASLGRHGPALRALQREAQTGLALDHPNIVRFQGLERDHDRFFIVMEWLPGRSLAEWMDGHPGEAMPINEVLRILRELGAALDYAHEQGVVHADVKPGNVMLLPDGSVRLCDFGIARFDKLLATRTGSFDPSVLRAATPAYSSPEVLRGDNPQVEDDVYSLACLTYRLLAGRRVFGKRDAAEAEEAGETAAPIEGLDAARWSALQRGLALRRDARQASVRQFVSEFAGTEAPPLGNGRGRAVAVLLVVAVAAAAAVWAYLADESRRAADTAPAIAREPVPDLLTPSAPAPVPAHSASGEAPGPPVKAGPETSPALAAAESPDRPPASVVVAERAEVPVAPPPVLPGAGADAIRFARERVSVGEDSTVIRVELIRYNAGGQRLPFVVRYDGGSARVGEDFSLPAPEAMSFAQGETAVTLYLPLIDDAIPEPPEYFRLTLDESPEGVVSGLIVEITDDD